MKYITRRKVWYFTVHTLTATKTGKAKVTLDEGIVKMNN